MYIKKWNFERSKEFIIKNCSKLNWAEDGELPILESTVNKVIDTAHEIQDYFIQNQVILEIPHFCQCGDGSIDLNWDSFEKGYTVLYNYHSIEGESLYGDNVCRNWKNIDEIEIKIFNISENRKILGLFAKWCKLRNIDWEIKIKR